jgi:threonine aldolase
MDGARLLNAAVASGISARDYADEFDSVWIDFSKGLGAPVGAVLAGSTDFINKAWRWKHQFGGAMRQAGIIAAGALYALENNIERLSDDHVNAQLLAEGLKGINGIEVEPVETNIVFFSVSALRVTGEQFNGLLIEKGLRLSTMGASRLRAVTHLDVSQSQVEEALAIIRDVVQKL